jgi:hypothetical protein
MTKMMTSSVLAGVILLGLASSAFAARSPEAYRAADYPRASRLAGDPAPRRVSPQDDCTIQGTYHDWPYCFGGDRFQTGSAY